MNAAIRHLAIGLLVGQFGFTPVALAAEPSTEDADREKALAEAHAEDLKEALAELKLAADFLAAQKSFYLEAALGYDVVQANGQKLEFGGSRKITMRRPDRVKAEAESREGTEGTLFFDGKSISIDLEEENAYVSVEKPGSLDAAFDYLAEDLGVPTPLADLLSSNFFTDIADRIVAGFIVGESRIGDAECIHVAFSTEDLDVQMWIENSDRPLPHRFVITYREAEGSPQFWAQLMKWNLKPKTPDSLFSYKPPKGAERIPFVATVVGAVEDAKASKGGN
ncbi:MAG: DUF2092 domain-containing protein [Deltaproteobacteria bacterium]|nr:DUF2092 domain-containing protein [Deltaproteobacteria bacterium]MBW2694387.1 DUF2092 domain-containing protein [Deltaproteobacteria bacterium]